MTRRRILICGAAGRDFHNFNVAFRDRLDVEVVAFTATQIPGIESRRYPAALAGSAYPDGIPIHPESDLESLCRAHGVDDVIFAYSDVTHDHVMQVASRALAAGADFTLLGPHATQIASTRPVISVCAVRTGCGKSQVARYLAGQLTAKGRRPGVIRHPMPYGRIADQSVQRFASRDDLDAAHCTLEEREEYEPHIEAGGVIFAGVDYERILRTAENEADVILWDGGNNDFCFYRPSVSIVVVDALRPGQLDTHHPGTTVLRMADIVVINKIGAATPALEAEQIRTMNEALDHIVPDVPRVLARSPVTVSDPSQLQGARVLVVEDGPTITHGGMPWGAGWIAATHCGATVVDPRAFAAADIRAVYEAFPHIGAVLPAMGYSDAQLVALRQTISAAGVDLVISGTPIDLARDLALDIPVVRARYCYEDAGEPRLMDLVEAALAR